MKGTVILSLSLDVLAIGILLVPAERYGFISRDPRVVTLGKRACFVALLLAGFLIDTLVTHGG